MCVAVLSLLLLMLLLLYLDSTIGWSVDALVLSCWVHSSFTFSHALTHSSTPYTCTWLLLFKRNHSATSLFNVYFSRASQSIAALPAQHTSLIQYQSMWFDLYVKIWMRVKRMKSTRNMINNIHKPISRQWFAKLCHWVLALDLSLSHWHRFSHAI